MRVRPYRLLVTEDALDHFMALPLRRRQRLRRALRALADRPLGRRWPEITDVTGRVQHMAAIEDWIVTFALDHAACELRVSSIDAVDAD